MNTLEEWTALACAELGVEPGGVDHELLLCLAKSVVRDVGRPSATVTVYLLGVAVGRGMSGADAATRLSTLAEQWRGADWRD